MNEILPSILNVNNLEDFLQTITALNDKAENKICKMQIDIMDGVFVKNKFEDLTGIQKIKEYGFLADVHLMVEKPIELARKAISFGADCITIHYEIKDFDNTLKSLIKEKTPVAVSICPETDVTVLKPILEQIHHVLLMSVHPGKGGQAFIENTYDKIKEIRKFSNIPIIVDGGVNDSNIKAIFDAGANEVVVGSYLTKNIDLLNERVDKLSSLI